MEGKRFLGQYLIWVILLLGQLHECKSCIEKERIALLDLKKYWMSMTQESELDYVFPTWNNDTKSDCCIWEGIVCNRTSGRLIKLYIGSLDLKENCLLNISLLHPFEEVRSLELSAGLNGFVDNIEGYKSLRKLRNLEIMDLSYNRFNNNILPFLNAATSLTSLSLENNDMEGPFPFEEIKDLTNLQQLDLSRNRLDGPMQGLTHLKNLKALDLSSNVFSSIMELQEMSPELSRQIQLVLLFSLSCCFPNYLFAVVCELKNLWELDLRENYFVGQLPLCLGRLNKLRVLDFSSNQLNGNLPSSFNSLESLEYLSLLNNNFTSLFSFDPLANLTKLKVFKLSSTSDMLQIKTESNWGPKFQFQLSVVVLRVCSLEKIPSFLEHQKNLRLIDLSNNRLSGKFPTWMLANNPELKVLQLQNNLFTIFQMPTIVHNLQFLDFSVNDISGLLPDNIGHALPNLVRMNGSNNGFQGHLPSSMGEMVNITFLDLSYNNFSGNLPRSFVMGCFSLKHLKLSHNKFSGHFLPRETSFTSMEELRMDSNLFTGKIGVGLLSSNTTLSILDMSNNFLTGNIPSWMANLSSLNMFSISNNFLEGTIPPSLLAISFLSLIDLSGNILSGALPSHVGGEFGIKLFLHDNNLTGPIPDTLLEKVQILDLRYNKLSGSIPQFVNTESIFILLLRGNNLTGPISSTLCHLRKIRLLDLSDNKLNGFIPSCLYNLSFGREDTNFMIGPAISKITPFKFYESTFVVEEFVVMSSTLQGIEIKFSTKRRYDSYFGATEFNNYVLDFMYGMDLSSNELSGVIPAELGDLSKLRVMNLSRNFLSSSIPSNFSNLKDIESLDLSHNKLQGRIPHELTNLSSLVVFDVSYNNLSGIIPQGRQFNTFDENSYSGNSLLCGPPTNRSCEAKKSSEESENGGGEEDVDEAPIDMLAFYFSTASTYVTVLIGIMILMSFDCPLRRAWLRIVDDSIASVKGMLP
ncbi:receptor-like protein 12 isoform X3 [Arabidopsis lyrata subsp. lyrata]|uniref:receptor-like protein 12 isoform X3 n=1 Tax=Arabidopsis lyrata subsp. lyrata TaxID=81972 RepID=UPI000A29A4D2|nr:receptor-like protein 12 isoform X3 [Arabidopsis lyrata subsp. lyrata]|eukprot:XP_020866562.1 receptor-like protein 12 isoform X3 [Arabidopsis lyrata subsp. lyrata]